MAVREVDEEQFLRDEKLRNEIAAIWANPEAKKLVQKAQKIVNPKAVTPDLDREESDNERLAGVNKKLDEMSKLLETQQAESAREKSLAALNAKIDAGLSKLRSQGWTQEGLDGVRKLMDEKGLPDPEDAAVLFERLHPPQAPIASASSGFFEIVNPQDNDDFLKSMLGSKGESDGAMQKKIAETLAEVRGQSRR